MTPQLTAGAIQRILNKEDVSKVVIQLLGCKKIPGSGNDRYRLLISDGVLGCPFAMLGTQLNHMVTNKELEKFTIVQVDKCVCNNVQPDKKVIILLSLSVLVPGAQVGEKLGNPINAPSSSSDSSANSNAPPKESYNNGMQNSATYDNQQSMFGENALNVHPISSLTPYQNKWTVKVRVTSKSGIRTWSNSRGEGKLFSVNLLDESGEIKATGFNEGCDKFYDMLEVNKVYYISKGSLKTANPKFNTTKNDYEMSLNADTTIVPCEDNTSAIPMLQFDFMSIQQIEQVNKDANVDVIGICKSASDVQTIVVRSSNKELTKREIRLVDKSNTEISLTLWGTDAEKFDGSSNPVVAVKGARVSDFNGRSLSVGGACVLQINPDIKEAHVLKGWYDREGCNMESQSLSNRGGPGGSSMAGSWKTFAQASGENLGMGEKPDYYSAKATVVLVRKENCMYMACPSEECNKKVVDMNNGMYRCEKCGREYDSFKWRLLISASIADFTENQWVTCFQEPAEALLGIPAQELGSLKQSDEDKYNDILSDANFKSFVFKLRTKMEVFNEESRLKTTVMSAVPVEPLVYGKKLLGDIRQMQQVL